MNERRNRQRQNPCFSPARIIRKVSLLESLNVNLSDLLFDYIELSALNLRKTLLTRELTPWLVLILDGNYVIGAHVRRNLCDLICFSHLIRSRAVMNRILFSEKSYFLPCLWDTILYKYHRWNFQGSLITQFFVVFFFEKERNVSMYQKNIRTICKQIYAEKKLIETIMQLGSNSKYQTKLAA